jgi:hypothetical protein
MYQHNRDRLLYTVVFYLLLVLTTNSFLWALTASAACAH